MINVGYLFIYFCFPNWDIFQNNKSEALFNGSLYFFESNKINRIHPSSTTISIVYFINSKYVGTRPLITK
jgi:hypothetical protein